MQKLFLFLFLSMACQLAMGQNFFSGTVTYRIEFSEALKQSMGAAEKIPTSRVFSYHDGVSRSVSYNGAVVIEDILYFPSTQKAYVLDQASKTAYVIAMGDLVHIGNDADVLFLHGSKTRTILAYSCKDIEVMERKYELEGPPYIETVWTTDEFKPVNPGDFKGVAILTPLHKNLEGLPLHIEVNMAIGGDELLSLYASKVDETTPDPALFVLPADYTIKPMAK